MVLASANSVSGVVTTFTSSLLSDTWAVAAIAIPVAAAMFAIPKLIGLAKRLIK